MMTCSKCGAELDEMSDTCYACFSLPERSGAAQRGRRSANGSPRAGARPQSHSPNSSCVRPEEAVRPEFPAVALSIRQPWAWLIIHGGKDIENRTWPTRFRGRVAVHAGKGMTRDEYEAAMLFIAGMKTSWRVVGDEFHNFAPKGKILDLEAGKCLHWSNRLMSEGRGYGLVCLIASQRPQKVHNDTLTCCETLVAMRVVHKADRAAVQDWIEGCGDLEKGREVLNALAGMARGEAFVWSPEIGFGPQRLNFPMFETFDSFAPPQLQRKVSNSGWGAVDLAAVKEKMAAVIEEAKANDPAELRRQLAASNKENTRLNREMAARGDARPTAKETVKEVPIFTDKDRVLIQRGIETCEKVFEKLKTSDEEVRQVYRTLNGLSGAIAVKLNQFKALPQWAGIIADPKKSVKRVGLVVESSAPVFRRPVPSTSSNGNGKLPKAESAILRVLANFPEGKSKSEVGVIAGYAHAGGGFCNAIGALRSKGFVMPGEPLKITPDGLDANGPVEPLPTGEALFQYWLNHPDLGRAEREILRVLVSEAKGGAWSKEEIAPLTVSDRGTPYESNGGGFNNAVGRLRTFELIEGKGTISAAKAFFE